MGQWVGDSFRDSYRIYRACFDTKTKNQIVLGDSFKKIYTLHCITVHIAAAGCFEMSRGGIVWTLRISSILCHLKKHLNIWDGSKFFRDEDNTLKKINVTEKGSQCLTVGKSGEILDRSSRATSGHFCTYGEVRPAVGRSVRWHFAFATLCCNILSVTLSISPSISYWFQLVFHC